MENDVEDFGPLTPEQLLELQNHPLYGDGIFETDNDIRWYRNVLSNTSTADPTFARFLSACKQALRYVGLLRRFETYGAGPVVQLKKQFH